jgi:nitrite reductase/ring-hydroxylating ferredoxin subunit
VMARRVVATVDEIPPGTRKIVEIDGRSIGVFNVGGEFFALRNRCPHQGGPLCLGERVGALSAQIPGEYRYERPGELIRCPWHGWEFDLRTGRSWFDPAHTRVRNYPVEVLSGHELGDGAPSTSELVPGPYMAETYSVSVDQNYLLVEVGG